ncbi:hypothetical protein PanWU01x14_062010 [Parasponia andersonii]|uniref:Uncharacterized protein n=1 Tax=Parasponia andersonii TaxID=3476 RepID=A0A2P5DIC7_PARAD|nr:hypothetical protein PanWU01x14_062010 [Parasponia andersonii]
MIWKDRNSVVHGKPDREPLALLEDVESWLSKFKHFYSPELPKVRSRLHVGWSLSPPGSLKLNMDAAVFYKLYGSLWSFSYGLYGSPRRFKVC